MIELAVPTGKRRYLIRIIRKLSHVVWKCKHHLVWCPKYRIRNLNSEVGRSVQDIIKQLCVCVWKDVKSFSLTLGVVFSTEEFDFLDSGFLGV